MRGLVRRIQNRGYATLPRIADHIDSLTAGDESNAVLEALDAVNLMTVHAAKGLEFPVVFVVNLAKGASGPPRPVRVMVDGDTGEPSVSIGPFVSETDEAERDREKQETRRLLYVALTRARDRLYLSAALKDGVLQPGRGSLAEVLPDSFKDLFTRAATAFDECGALAWSGPSGRAFEWRLCRPPQDLVTAEPQVATRAASAARRRPLRPAHIRGSHSPRSRHAVAHRMRRRGASGAGRSGRRARRHAGPPPVPARGVRRDDDDRGRREPGAIARASRGARIRGGCR